MLIFLSVLALPDALEDKKLSYEKVKQAKELIIGLKQTTKAIEQNAVSEVIIAKDADSLVIERIVTLASSKGIPIAYVDSKRKLGKACGIDVHAATCGIKK